MKMINNTKKNIKIQPEDSAVGYRQVHPGVELEVKDLAFVNAYLRAGLTEVGKEVKVEKKVVKKVVKKKSGK